MRTALFCIIAIFININLISFAHAGDVWRVELLLTAPWGEKEGMFGRELEGKTELGFAMDMVVSTDAIYILDSINDRIQVFEFNGKLRRVIMLQTKWKEMGLPYHFALTKEHIYFLIGRPPYYSPMGIREINQFSIDGKLIKTFGGEFIPRERDEFYDKLFSKNNGGLIIAGISSMKVLAFDETGIMVKKLSEAKKNEIIKLEGICLNGDPIISKSINNSSKTTIIDMQNNIQLKTVSGKYSFFDSVNNYYFIKSKPEYNKNDMIIKTKISRLSSNNKLTSAILTENPIKDKIVNSSAFYEVIRIDQNGVIYQLIGYEKGVVLRRITRKY